MTKYKYQNSKNFLACDVSTHKALADATEFVKVIEKRTGLKIACLEEIAWRYHWISTDDLRKQIERQKSSYYTYIQNLKD